MKKFKIYLFLSLILILAYSDALFAQQPAEGKRVLFVGNSYTYFWNLPQQVAEMAATQNIDLITRQSTAGGSNLGMHVKGEHDLKTVELIKNDQYGVVILQDYSLRPVNEPDSTFKYGTILADLAKANGAEVILYLTWAREKKPEMQAGLTKTYTELAKSLGAKVAPVGPAFERARTLQPDIQLYDPDGSHPSTVGTYLSACVFYAVLTGNSPIGLPARLIGKDKDGEKLYLNILGNDQAAFCQKVADEIVKDFLANFR